METNETLQAVVAAKPPRAPRAKIAKADKPAKAPKKAPKKAAKPKGEATKALRARKPAPKAGEVLRKHAARVVDGERIPVVKKVGNKTADFSDYRVVVSASGNTSLDNGDPVAEKLRGKTLDEVYAIAAKYTNEAAETLRKRYSHLNPGMQRMNLGNKIRGAMEE